MMLPSMYENAYTDEIARVVYYEPQTEQWLMVRSRNVSTGFYDSVQSAQNALRQFNSGWRARYTYKVQQLVADSEGYMFWYDV